MRFYDFVHEFVVTPSMKPPLVSILIPSYSRPGMLQRAISSALNQTFQDLEVVVVDDPGPDSCRKVIESFSDSRLRTHFHPARMGCWQNVDFALHLAEGEYVAILGDDDSLSPNFIERHLASLRQGVGLSASFGMMHELSESGQFVRHFDPEVGGGGPIGGEDFLRAVLRQKVFLGSALLRRTDLITAWDETREDDIVADQGVLLRLAAVRPVRTVWTPEAVYFKTVHSTQLSSNFVAVSQAYLKTLLRLRTQLAGTKHGKQLRIEAAHLSVVLARHHAAIGRLSTARSLLLRAILLAPLLPVIWGQFLQSVLLPGRLERTSRQQRGMEVPGARI